MGTSPYSLDLRKRVVNYIEKGGSKKEASELYSLHRNTVSRWCNRYKKEGLLGSRCRPGAKRRLDIDKVVSFVENNPNSNLSEIGKHFEITPAWASIMLKKLGFSYKKKPSPTWKQTKRREIDTKKS